MDEKLMDDLLQRIESENAVLNSMTPGTDEYSKVQDNILKDVDAYNKLAKTQNESVKDYLDNEAKLKAHRQRYIELGGKIGGGIAIAVISWFADDGRRYVQNIGRAVRDFFTFK